MRWARGMKRTVTTRAENSVKTLASRARLTSSVPPRASLVVVFWKTNQYIIM
jgi:hypothetical protein